MRGETTARLTIEPLGDDHAEVAAPADSRLLSYDDGDLVLVRELAAL